MILRHLKKIIALVLFILVAGVFSRVLATNTNNVQVTVKDNKGNSLSFASVTVNQSTLRTGSHGEAAVFSLDNGNYALTANHPLVLNKKHKVATGKAKLKLSNKKPTLALSVKLKGSETVDGTAPTLTNLKPNTINMVDATHLIDLQVEVHDTDSQLTRPIAAVTATVDGHDQGSPAINDAIYSWLGLNLSEGSHHVVYTAWNYSGQSANLGFDFRVVPATGTVSGQILAKTATGTAPLNNVVVALNDAARSSRNTDSNGRYSLDVVRAGNYSATITASGYATQTAPANVTAGATTTINATLLDQTAPNMPANLVVTNTNPTVANQHISWDAVPDQTGSGITYDVRQYQATTLINSQSTANLSQNYTNLTANTSYGYSARAKDGVGNTSAWSPTIRVSTQKTPTLSWTQPTNNQTVSGKITLKVNYQAFGSGNSTKQIDWLRLPGTTLGTTTPNLASGTDSLNWDTSTVTNGIYDFQTKATDNQGNSSTANLKLNIQNVSAGAISGKVTYAGTAIAGAVVTSDESKTTTTDASGNYQVPANNGNRQVTVSLSGLTQQTKSVTVSNGQTATLDIAMIDAITPSVPQQVTAANVSPTATTQQVSWQAASDYSGILNYDVQQLNGSSIVKTVAATGASTTFTNLNPWTDYSYKVRSRDKANPANVSGWSNVATYRTQKMPTATWLDPAANQALSGQANFLMTYTVYSRQAQQLDWINVTDNTVIAHTPLTAASNTMSLDWDTTLVSNGAKTLRLTLTDNEGNTVSSDVSVTVNNVAVINASLSGKISQSGTTTGVVGINVSLSDSNTIVVGSAVSDASGNYTISGLTTIGNFQLKAVAQEGFLDATSTVTVNNGANTANVSLTILPRANFDASSIRGLPIPPGNLSQPSDLDISNNGRRLTAICNIVCGFVVYDPTTEQYVNTLASSVTGALLASNSSGYLAGEIGRASWYSSNGQDLGIAGPNIKYHDIIRLSDNTTAIASPSSIYHLFDPTSSYDKSDITPIVGGIDILAASDRRYYVSNLNGWLYRLSLSNPTDASSTSRMNLGYRPAVMRVVPGTRTLVLLEAGTANIHFVDTVSMQEYAMITVNLSTHFGLIPNGAGLATMAVGTTGAKLFFTSIDLSQIYALTATLQ